MNHGSNANQRPAPRVARSDRLVTASRLSDLTGVSVITIRNMLKKGLMPKPVARDEHGYGLFDLADDKLAAWVKALQDAGYNRR